MRWWRRFWERERKPRPQRRPLQTGDTVSVYLSGTFGGAVLDNVNTSGVFIRNNGDGTVRVRLTAISLGSSGLIDVPAYHVRRDQ